MFNCLIVDDEALARLRIRQLLKGHPELRVAGECSGGVEAVQAIEDTAPDLVFLDIQMPELDGFGVIEAVAPERMPAVLFVTAHDEYALRAFEVNALDYLLKPIGRVRFERALERALGRLRNHERPSLAPLEALVRQDRQLPDRFLVKDGARFVFVRVPAIQWLEAENNYVRLHMEDTSHLIRQTMAGILERLPANRFRRIHRSAIVNVDFIRDLEPWAGGDCLVNMKDGTQLTLSRTYRDSLQEFA